MSDARGFAGRSPGAKVPRHARLRAQRDIAVHGEFLLVESQVDDHVDGERMRMLKVMVSPRFRRTWGSWNFDLGADPCQSAGALSDRPHLEFAPATSARAAATRSSVTAIWKNRRPNSSYVT